MLDRERFDCCDWSVARQLFESARALSRITFVITRHKHEIPTKPSNMPNEPIELVQLERVKKHWKIGITVVAVCVEAF